MRFHDYDVADFSAIAAGFGSERYAYVVTPNVDHLIRFCEDAAFRRLYATAGYVLNDSRFLSKVMSVARGVSLRVCTGSDLTEELLSRVIQPNDPVLLIGARSVQAKQLAHRYGLRALKHFEPPMGFIKDPDAVEECLRFIEAETPFRFCFLALGSPQQEILASKLRDRGVARGLTLCVGASIDYLTEQERRAPRWMQDRGVEWAYRLVQNPRRLAKRYLVRGPRIFLLLRHIQFELVSPLSVRASAELEISRETSAGLNSAKAEAKFP